MIRGLIVSVAVLALPAPAARPSVAFTHVRPPTLAPQAPKNHKEFREPGQFFLYHHKDWLPVPGLGNVVVSLVQNKGEAVVIVERFVTEVVPDTNTSDFMNLVVGIVKNSDPRAQNIVPAMSTSRQKGIQVDYTRAGILGQEQLRLYTFLVGTNLFRITCVARPDLFRKHMAAFAAVVESVTAAAEPAHGALVGSR